MATVEEYYEDEAQNLHGNYQKVSFNSLVENLVAETLNEDSIINNVPKRDIIRHLKNGIREIATSTFISPRFLELEISSSLTMVMPADCVDVVRAWIFEDGYLYPLMKNNRIHTGGTYLQAENFDILFDEDGFPLEADGYNVYSQGHTKRTIHPDYCIGDVKRTLDTSKISVNGEYKVDKNRGVIAFSSELSEKVIVLEYTSDGLESKNVWGTDLTVSKHLITTLNYWVFWKLVEWRKNVRQYEKDKAEKAYYNAKRKVSKRMNPITVAEIRKAMASANKWI